jgi:hypothetical protein
MEHKYKYDKHNVIYQVDPEPFEYTEEYMESYNNLGQAALNRMSRLRLKYIRQTIGMQPRTILDIGYGSGSFIRHCKEQGIASYGNDVCKYEMPPGTAFAEIDDTPYDVITLYDTLEHFHDISFLGIIRPEFLVITVPWRPFVRSSLCEYAKTEEFLNWKHRKPNEHIRHFDLQSLKSCVESYGFEMIAVSNIEDTIRIPSGNTGYPNILTEVFKRVD